MKGAAMPKGSPELTEARRTEIMEACKKLYETMTFKEVNLKEIGKVTTFTRTSIYNYFESKEEIFLGLFEDEYIKWTADLQKMIDEDVPCEDILTQINAANGALHRIGLMILEGHLRHCVREGIESGNADEVIENFADALEHFARIS